MAALAMALSVGLLVFIPTIGRDVKGKMKEKKQPESVLAQG